MRKPVKNKEENFSKGTKENKKTGKSNTEKGGVSRYRENAAPSDFSSAKPKFKTDKKFKTNRSDKQDFKLKKFDKPFKKKFNEREAKVGSKPAIEPNPFDLDESDYAYMQQYEQSRGKENNTNDGSEAQPYRKGNNKRFHKRKLEDETEEKSGTGLIRLNKYISNAGICSRREADELIKSGAVSVNGKVITQMGFQVKPTDIINYGGETLKKEKMVYLVLNKPKDYITTLDDPEKRKTVQELIHGACRERVYPVGRLDRNTTGLLIFTNDGELTKKLTHPKYGVRKIYHVELDKPLKVSDMQKIAEGIELEDGEIKVDEITFVGDGKDKTQIGVQLHSGKNRIVRRIFEHFGYNVRKLDRVMFGSLTKKDLPRGRWRMLTASEIGMLKMTAAK